MAARAWNVELLGTLRARREDQIVARFKTHKTGALFGYLACQDSPRPLRREEIIEMLWPEVEGESGRNRLRIALTALRAEFELPGELALIHADRTTIHLEPEAFHTDKAKFEALLQRALTAPEDAERADCLEKAIGLYRGELLPGFDEGWIPGERQRLADAYLMALRRLVKYYTQSHDYETALDYARRALRCRPLPGEIGSYPDAPLRGYGTARGGVAPVSRTGTHAPGRTGRQTLRTDARTR